MARLVGVRDTSIIRGAAFSSQKLAQKLAEQGFEAAAFLEDGIPPKAVWLIIEYYAYDANRKTEQAIQLARTFGQLGIDLTFQQLQTPKPSEDRNPANLSRLDIIKLALEAEEENLRLKAQIEENVPKVEFYDDVAVSKDMVTLSQFFRANGIGRNRGFKTLRDMGIIQKSSPIPYQNYIDQGYFVVKLKNRKFGDKTIQDAVTVITGKGEQFIHKKLKEADKREEVTIQVESLLNL